MPGTTCREVHGLVVDRSRDWSLLHHLVRELRELGDDELERLGLERSGLDALREVVRTGLADPPEDGRPSTPEVPPAVAEALPQAAAYVVDRLGIAELGYRTPHTAEEFREFAERVAARAG